MRSRDTLYSLYRRLKGSQPLRACLVFNPASGSPAESNAQLAEILGALQRVRIIPEVFLVNQGANLEQVVRQAVDRGNNLVIAAGGDGTIDSVAGGLANTGAAIGIIPTGTQNNVARTLGIPLGDIPGAVRILRRGRRLRIDLAQARCGANRRWFLEAASAGLISALFPAADGIQHGEVSRVADLLATLIRSQPSQVRMKLWQADGCHTVTALAHVVLVSNMPFIGAQYQPSVDISYTDGLLDVFIFANLDKLDLIGYAVQAITGTPEDARIRHFQVHRAAIQADPAMPILADGFSMGEGNLIVASQPRALAVIAARAPRPVSARWRDQHYQFRDKP
jgi:YegS/Rv2252/BmrU family lipid kinase